MVIKVDKADFSFDNIVNLLCTATYGSEWLSCYIKERSDEPVLEGSWAKAWLSGHEVIFCDYYAEGCVNREENMPHINHIDGGEEVINYYITLDQAVESLNYAMEHGEERDDIVRCVHEWLSDSNDFDYFVANNIVQAIMFCDEVYG